uniref:cDNA FLJ26115 fis, clone SPL06819 n=1 Tax=Homo sapiens TaxID=9606 RepID=Q6ZPB6_HUMAN|nr:unnamed protein product [Homo sapiens]
MPLFLKLFFGLLNMLMFIWRDKSEPKHYKQCHLSMFSYHLMNYVKNVKGCPGAVAHTSTLGGQGGRITRDQEFETSLDNIVKRRLTKNINISRVWWQAPVVPAIWETEAGESLEPRRWRLQ